LPTAVAAPMTPAGLEPYRLAEDDLERLVEENVLTDTDARAIADGGPVLFSIAQYHRIAEAGILGPKDRVILLEGQLVRKMTIHPPHAWSVAECLDLLRALLGANWTVRSQQPITLATSVPEPDDWVARGPKRLYRTRHPLASDICLVVEVADSSLAIDRTHSARIYGAAGIPVYWIVNLIDRQVEVMTGPNATGYAARIDYLPGEAVPVILDGVHVGDLLVDDPPAVKRPTPRTPAAGTGSCR